MREVRGLHFEDVSGRKAKEECWMITEVYTITGGRKIKHMLAQILNFFIFG